MKEVNELIVDFIAVGIVYILVLFAVVNDFFWITVLSYGLFGYMSWKLSEDCIELKEGMKSCKNLKKN